VLYQRSNTIYLTKGIAIKPTRRSTPPDVNENNSFFPTPFPLALASVFIAVSVYADDDDDEGGPPIEGIFKTELVFPQSQGEAQLGTLPTYCDGPEGTAFMLPIGMEYEITDSLQL